jgi:GNAT superfamily N-acetyltransferase
VLRVAEPLGVRGCRRDTVLSARRNPNVAPHIRSLRPEDVERVVRLSLDAWEPVFASFRQILGPRIYDRIYPDWRVSQAAAVESVCTSGIDGARMTVWVAEEGGELAGFIAYSLNPAKKVGEVELLAVDPAFQNRGIGTLLNTFALARLQESGMDLAVVGTGGDPGHAPARRSYEKAGYTPLPLVRYYKVVGADPPGDPPL